MYKFYILSHHFGLIISGDLQIITNAKLRKIIIKAQTTGSPRPLIGKYVRITIIDELNTLIKEKMSSSRI